MSTSARCGVWPRAAFGRGCGRVWKGVEEITYVCQNRNHTSISPPLCPPRQGYDILEDMYSPKTAVSNLAHELCSKKKAHLDAFMMMVVQVQGIGAWDTQGNSLP